MRLLSTVLGWLLRKVGLYLGLLLSLFLVYLFVSALVPALRQAEASRDRLVEVTQEKSVLEDDLAGLVRARELDQAAAVESFRAQVEDEVADRRRQLEEQQAQVADRREERDAGCGRIRRLIEKAPIVPNTCEAAERALAAAEAAQQTFEDGLAQAREGAAVVTDPSLTDAEKAAELDLAAGRPELDRDIAGTQADLEQTRAEERRLRAAQGSWAGRVVLLWSASWRWLALLAAIAIVLPGLVKLASYFVLMPVVSRAGRPLRLEDGSDSDRARVSAGEAERSLTIRLAPGETLSARAQHVRPVEGSTSSALLYSWTSPFISFAAGLYGLRRVIGGADGTHLTLASPDDADAYLMRIDFEEHPGVVIYPKHVVGVVGEPRLEKRWRWGLHALATWQLRYVLFAGSGSLIVEGSGDVRDTAPVGARTRMDQHLVMGFDSRTSVRISRTEDFWGYMWGRAPLAVDEYSGPYPFFWQKSSVDGPKNPVARSFDALFSAVGKLLGF